MKYIIQTNRLRIRELVLEDADNLAKVLCDSNSMKYYHTKFSHQDVEYWITINIKRYKIYGYGLWGVELKQTNQIIGDCGLTIQNIDSELLPEIGFHISPEYCLNGYATEASKGIIKFCKKRFNLKTIFSYCEIENTSSIKTMEKIGMDYWKKYTENNIVKVVYKKIIG